MIEVQWDTVLEEVQPHAPQPGPADILKALREHAAQRIRKAGEVSYSDPEREVWALADALTAVELWDAIRYASIVMKSLEEKPDLCQAIFTGKGYNAPQPAIARSQEAAEKLCGDILKALSEEHGNHA